MPHRSDGVGGKLPPFAVSAHHLSPRRSPRIWPTTVHSTSMGSASGSTSFPRGATTKRSRAFRRVDSQPPSAFRMCPASSTATSCSPNQRIRGSGWSTSRPGSGVWPSSSPSPWRAWPPATAGCGAVSGGGGVTRGGLRGRRGERSPGAGGHPAGAAEAPHRHSRGAP